MLSANEQIKTDPKITKNNKGFRIKSPDFSRLRKYSDIIRGLKATDINSMPDLTVHDIIQVIQSLSVII